MSNTTKSFKHPTPSYRQTKLLQGHDCVFSHNTNPAHMCGQRISKSHSATREERTWIAQENDNGWRTWFSHEGEKLVQKSVKLFILKQFLVTVDLTRVTFCA
jgi:hypothetical protein